MPSSTWISSEIAINTGFLRSHYDMKSISCIFISFKYFRFVVMQIV